MFCANFFFLSHYLLVLFNLLNNRRETPPGYGITVFVCEIPEERESTSALSQAHRLLSNDFPLPPGHPLKITGTHAFRNYTLHVNFHPPCPRCLIVEKFKLHFRLVLTSGSRFSTPHLPPPPPPPPPAAYLL